MNLSTIPKLSGFQALAVVLAVLLPACSLTEEALFPSLTGKDPAGGPAKSASEGTKPQQKVVAQPKNSASSREW